jgi:hypothetical protein
MTKANYLGCVSLQMGAEVLPTMYKYRYKLANIAVSPTAYYMFHI